MTSTMSREEYTKLFPNPPDVRDSLLSELVVKPWLPATHKPYYLTNASVVDTVNGGLLDGPHCVKVVGGEITAVERQSEADLEHDVETHDLHGAFLCPGLIDAHVHVTAVPGVETMSDMLRLKEQQINLRTPFVLRGMLRRGFTTVRDTGGASKFIANAIEEGLIEGPRLFQCGKAISQTGGHGDLTAPGVTGGDGSGCCGGTALSYGRTADGVPAVLKATREELKQGGDFIKIMLGGGVSSETDAVDHIQYSTEEVQAIVNTAWQAGEKMCTAHAYTVKAMRHAIDNGVLGIEHGNFLDAATAQLMVDRGVYLTPTVSCIGIMARKPYERFLTADGLQKGAAVIKEGLNALKIAHDAGVNICFGTDLLISMHALQTEEFSVRAMVQPAAAILLSATVTPARMLKREGKLGVIAAGAKADMLVLKANPLEDIAVLDRPEENLRAVFKEGRLMSGSI